MKTAVEFYNPDLPLDVRRELPEMQAWLMEIPDPPEGLHPDGLWSCHVLARAVHMAWRLGERGWTVVDGHFDRGMRHSWLENGKLILDVYPVASCGGPILFDQHVWRRFYVEDAQRFVPRRDEFERDARRLAASYAASAVRQA